MTSVCVVVIMAFNTYSLILLFTLIFFLCVCVFESRIIHSEGFSRDECKQYRPVVYSNTIRSLEAVIRGMDLLGITFANPARRVRDIIIDLLLCQFSV